MADTHGDRIPDCDDIEALAALLAASRRFIPEDRVFAHVLPPEIRQAIENVTWAYLQQFKID